MESVLNVLLSHQYASGLANLLQWWQPYAASGELLLAYGGTKEHFAEIDFEPKCFVDDPRLRTRDNQRELQSLGGIFRAAARWLAKRPRQYSFVHLIEYDHLPLIADLNQRQLERLHEERADVLAYHLRRVDRTSYAHYLYHAHNPAFHPFVRNLSVRADKDVILSMLGTGSFWRARAFEAVAAIDDTARIYGELFVPTVAHHLGFRLRDFREQNAFVTALGERGLEVDAARRSGGWSLHPVKRYWDVPRPALVSTTR
jgi:hypothetical protein